MALPGQPHKLDKTFDRIHDFNMATENFEDPDHPWNQPRQVDRSYRKDGYLPGVSDPVKEAEHAPEPVHNLPPPEHIRGPVDREDFITRQERLDHTVKVLEVALEKVRSVREMDRQMALEQGQGLSFGLNP